MRADASETDVKENQNAVPRARQARSGDARTGALESRDGDLGVSEIAVAVRALGERRRGGQVERAKERHTAGHEERRLSDRAKRGELQRRARSESQVSYNAKERS